MGCFIFSWFIDKRRLKNPHAAVPALRRTRRVGEAEELMTGDERSL